MNPEDKDVFDLRKVRVIKEFRPPILEGFTIQNLSLPPPFISYICSLDAKPSPQLLYKLYFSCKFFYPKVKVIPVDKFSNMVPQSYNGQPNPLWFRSILQWQEKSVILPTEKIYEIGFKLYGVGAIIIAFSERLNAKNPYFLSSFLFKIIWYARGCDVRIYKQILTVGEYKTLVEISQKLSLGNISVKDVEGKELACEELLLLSPNVTEFAFTSPDFDKETAIKGMINGYTSETTQILSTIKRSTKLKNIFLGHIAPSFDPYLLCTFFMNNMATNAHISFGIDADFFTAEQEKDFKIVIKTCLKSMIESNGVELSIHGRWKLEHI